jgi:hypothetical protein
MGQVSDLRQKFAMSEQELFQSNSKFDLQLRDIHSLK